MRRSLLLFILVIAVACGRDNASPFTHGAKNAPSNGGSTRAPRTDTTSTTTAVDFGRSSGNAGGYVKVGGAAGGGAAAATATGNGSGSPNAAPAPPPTTTR